jgi:peptidoglycan/xylan/chitin deacetylase (PgdA/CDA1 family)
MRTVLAALCLAAAACSTLDAPPSALVEEIAPTGHLRAALAANDRVSRDVARQLARHLQVRLEATTFDAPFDVAFALPEAARAAQLDFTEPYLVLDARPRVIALPRGRPQAGEYLRKFVDELKSTGFVAQSIERRGVQARASVPK